MENEAEAAWKASCGPPTGQSASDFGPAPMNVTTSTSSSSTVLARQQQQHGSQAARPEWMSKINYTLAPGDKLVQCPYNVHHLVLFPKMAMHLWKCRKAYIKLMEQNNEQVVYERCHYNEYHVMCSKELSYHHERCPDRESGAAYYRKKYDKIYSLTQAIRIQEHEIEEEEKRRKKEEAASNAEGEYNYANAPNADDDDEGKAKDPKKDEPEEEDWDEEMRNNPNKPLTTYDPRPHLRARNYKYFLPGGLTKSERKQFRKSVHEMTGTQDYEDYAAGAAAGPSGSLRPQPTSRQPSTLVPFDEDDEDNAGYYYVENDEDDNKFLY